MATGLSAVKLEKAIMNLEARLREEFRQDLARQVSKQMQPYVQQMKLLTSQVKGLAGDLAQSKSMPCHNMELERAADEADGQGFVQVDIDKWMQGQAHVDLGQAQPIVSIGLGDLFSAEKGASQSVGPEAGGAGGVHEVVREVARAAMEHHQATLEKLEMLEEGGKPGGEKYLKESSQASLMDDVVEEPVAFLETAWNLVLVLGHTDCGLLDLAIACFLWLASGLMQISFFVILLSEA